MDKGYRPKAREQELAIYELPDELLVYDLRSDRAHCLNRASRDIWRACDGKRTTEDVAFSLDDVSAEVVQLALQQLRERDLLIEPMVATSNGDSRREMLKVMGAASAAALPLISSITARPATESLINCVCTTNASCTAKNCPSTTNCNPSGVCAPP